MSVAARLTDYLNEEKVSYRVLKHPKTFSAQGVASVLHVPGKEIAKSVVVKCAGRYALAVLPAPERVDLGAFPHVDDSQPNALATEAEIRSLFPDCETGAIPPFGNLYGLPVYVDMLLTEDRKIVFEAGSHQEALQMSFQDFARLAHPEVRSFAVHD